MKLTRRKSLYLAAGAVAFPAVPRIARAETYPSRAVRIVVGFPAGLAPDIVARLIAPWLSVQLGQQFIVDNRPGAASNIAAEAVARAPSDGYTLFLSAPPSAFNAALYENLNFNFIRDIAPIAGIASQPYVMAVNPSVPANTVPEFIAYAKAKPGKINMASAGNGSAPHVFGELFKTMAGVDMLHVPYRGSYLPDLLDGQVQVVFAAIPAVIGYIRAGRLRALAVTSTTRSDALPDIPTMGEFVQGYEASGWYGVCAPKSTSADIIDKLNNEINTILADPKMKGLLADIGAVPMPTTPADFGEFIAAETDKWGKVIKAANIKPD
jgi:tripartite-type tricarboxylate transporter receptor subunit TctC